MVQVNLSLLTQQTLGFTCFPRFARLHNIVFQTSEGRTAKFFGIKVDLLDEWQDLTGDQKNKPMNGKATLTNKLDLRNCQKPDLLNCIIQQVYFGLPGSSTFIPKLTWSHWEQWVAESSSGKCAQSAENMNSDHSRNKQLKHKISAILVKHLATNSTGWSTVQGSTVSEQWSNTSRGQLT